MLCTGVIVRLWVERLLRMPAEPGGQQSPSRVSSSDQSLCFQAWSLQEPLVLSEGVSAEGPVVLS